VPIVLLEVPVIAHPHVTQSDSQRVRGSLPIGHQRQGHPPPETKTIVHKAAEATTGGGESQCASPPGMHGFCMQH
jgi:hypothetical protein